MKENFTFLQISSLGKYLKDLVKRKAFKFFERHGFDDEELSRVSNCFGSSIIDQIKEDLSISPFSLTVDNVTAGGKSMCGLQVRYLKQYGEESGITRTKIENRIIGIKYLEESSKGEVLFNAVQEKLLNLGTEVKNNFRGLVHDHGANIAGFNIGLTGLLEKELDNYFMDLDDPCHSLNLALSKAYSTLPEELTQFLQKIQKIILFGLKGSHIYLKSKGKIT